MTARNAHRPERRRTAPKRRSGWRRLLLAALLAQPALLLAQIPSLLSLFEPPSTTPPETVQPLGDLAAERTRVEAHIQSAATQLTEVSAAVAAPPLARSDADERALQEQLGLLRARIQIGRRHLKVIDEAAGVREDTRRRQETIGTWTGFADKPPYSLPFVEELAQALKQQQAATQTDEARQAAFGHGKTVATAGLTEAQRQFRQTLEALESAQTDEAKKDARQQHALSQLGLSLSEDGMAFVRSSEQLLNETLALDRLREELTRKQLRVALGDLRLTETEVEARVKRLDQDLLAATEQLSRTETEEGAASRQLDRLGERLAAQKAEGRLDPLLDLEVQLRRRQLETIRASADDLNLRIGYLQAHQSDWRQRLDLHQHWDVSKARAELAEIATTLQIIDQGVSALERARAQVDDFSVERRFAAPELAEPRQLLVKAMQDRGARLAQTLRSAAQLRDFLDLWQREIEQRVGSLEATTPVKVWDAAVIDYLERLWSFELLSVDDTFVVDGQPMIEKRPVTIGKVIEAILILAIGLPLASALARLVSRMQRPSSAGRWQGRLLMQRVLRVGLIALVVILALVTVKIPLAVLAFLGGAIALGIGFGAKNLLNNFISGFIILGEGTVRVGDWIDIEGTRGVVESIGERSTRVRRFDGVRLLIPNSHFLESRVTNMTLAGHRTRIAIGIGVAYGSPTRAVEALLLDIARDNPLVLDQPAPVVVFEDFGDSALVFRLYVWIDLKAQDDYRAVLTELRHTIGERFAQSGYQIAFPQRDLHLDAKAPIPVQLLRPMDGDEDEPRR